VDLKLMDRVAHGGSVLASVFTVTACSLPWSPGSARLRRKPCRSHHIEDARDKAEQEKYNHSPRRNSKQAVDQPPNEGADKHAHHELGRETKAARECRGIPRGSAAWRARWARPLLVEPIAETPQPRGERSLVRRPGCWIVAIASVAHVFDTRDWSRRFPAILAAPKTARTILTRFR
jgi:hypothetical protein